MIRAQTWGVIKIHRNVIASIASIAATEIEGVKKVGKPSGRSLLEAFGARFGASPISVEIDKREEVRLEIPLVIKFGYNIPDISSKVQENVRSALERMTSITIKDIDINVQGIEREATP
jgi:uncharacterized alkaline shock family protein YloU